jgi:hypothetical protein
MKKGQYLLIYLAMFGGILYWLLTAPDPRFGLGYEVPLIVAGAVAAFAPAIKKLFTFRLTYWLPLLALPCCWVITFFMYGYLKKQFIQQGKLVAAYSNYSHLLMPVPYPTILSTQQDVFAIPDHGIQTCWANVLPCLEYPDSNIYMLGTDLSDGFRYGVGSSHESQLYQPAKPVIISEVSQK